MTVARHRTPHASAGAPLARERRSNAGGGLGPVREVVRSLRTGPVWSADHQRPPSAPPRLGSITPPALFVAADYPPPACKHKWVGFG